MCWLQHVNELLEMKALRLMQAQADSASPYVPRQDGSEGIGSYARKIAEAGLDLSASPREVVYNHPMVGKPGPLPFNCLAQT